MLVGALNRGARREDGLVLAHAAGGDGTRVRIVTERQETNHLDRARLEVWDHAPDVELALDLEQHVVAVAGARPVGAVRDARGRPVGFAATPAEISAATLRSAPDFGGFRLTRQVEVDVPAGPGEPVLLLKVQNTEFIQDAYHGYMRQFGPGLPKLMRLAASEPTYPFAVSALLRSAGFGLEVSVADGQAVRRVATVAPVGPAGPKTVAIPLGRVRAGATIRLAMLPEAWTVHEARVGARAAGAGTWRYVEPQLATLEGRGDRTARIPAAILAQVDDSVVSVGVQERVELRFPPTARSAERAQTSILRLTGYYEELDQSRKPCVRLGVLKRCLREENAFARFALERLAERSAAPRLAAPARLH